MKINVLNKAMFSLTIFLLGIYVAHAAGVSVPGFNLPALDGKTYSNRSLLGRPALVVFWASWCPVCQVELPKLHDLFEKVRNRGLQILAIGFADDEDKIWRYVQSHSDIFDFPVLYDADDKVAKRFGVFGTPTIYLINRTGKIIYETWLIDDPVLHDKLDDLLDKAVSAAGSKTLGLYQIAEYEK